MRHNIASSEIVKKDNLGRERDWEKPKWERREVFCIKQGRRRERWLLTSSTSFPEFLSVCTASVCVMYSRFVPLTDRIWSPSLHTTIRERHTFLVLKFTKCLVAEKCCKIWIFQCKHFQRGKKGLVAPLLHAKVIERLQGCLTSLCNVNSDLHTYVRVQNVCVWWRLLRTRPHSSE